VRKPARYGRSRALGSGDGCCDGHRRVGRITGALSDTQESGSGDVPVASRSEKRARLHGEGVS